LEERTAAVDYQTDTLDCKDHLQRLNASIAADQKSLAAAAALIAATQEKVEKVQGRLDVLNGLAAPKQAEASDLAQKITHSEATRQQENHVYAAKKKDARVVQRAVQAIFDKLAAENMTVFNFREQLYNTVGAVSDPTVHSLMKSAIAAVGVLTNAPQDVSNFRQLLALLLSELNSYQQSLDTAEASNRQLWATTLDQLQKQKTLLEDAVASRRSQIRHKEDRLRDFNDDIATANATLNSLPAKLARSQHEFEIWSKDCSEKTTVYEQESADRRLAASSMQALTRLLSFHDYITGRVLAVVTTNVSAPAHLTSKAGKHCCRVCVSGSVCGNKCLLEGQECPESEAHGESNQMSVCACGRASSCGACVCESKPVCV